jgi:hypothetical protein
MGRLLNTTFIHFYRIQELLLQLGVLPCPKHICCWTAVQFRKDSQDAEDYPGDGCWAFRSRLELRGNSGAFMSKKVSFGIAFAVSFIVAIVGNEIPARQMPLDYHAMITASIPLAAAWAIIFAFCIWRYGKRGLWLLIGAPIALWWPIWMILNHFPPCYYSHNCI